MNKKICLILCLIIIAAGSIYAEDSHFSLSLDPLWLTMNTYRVNGEYSLNRYFSAGLQGAYSPNFRNSDNEYSPITYLEYGLFGRFYIGGLLENWAEEKDFGEANETLTRLFQPAPRGFYTGLSFSRIASTSHFLYAGEAIDAEIKGWGMGIELGARYVMGNHKIKYFVEPYLKWNFYTSKGYDFYDATGSATSKPFGFDDSFNSRGLIGGIHVGLQY